MEKACAAEGLRRHLPHMRRKPQRQALPRRMLHDSWKTVRTTPKSPDGLRFSGSSPVQLVPPLYLRGEREKKKRGRGLIRISEFTDHKSASSDTSIPTVNITLAHTSKGIPQETTFANFSPSRLLPSSLLLCFSLSPPPPCRPVALFRGSVIVNRDGFSASRCRWILPPGGVISLVVVPGPYVLGSSRGGRFSPKG